MSYGALPDAQAAPASVARASDPRTKKATKSNTAAEAASGSSFFLPFPKPQVMLHGANAQPYQASSSAMHPPLHSPDHVAQLSAISGCAWISSQVLCAKY